MLQVYRVLTTAAGPLALLLLRWRAAGPVRLRSRWKERSGRFERAPGKPVIWIHAASVGEVNGVQGLVRTLARRNPEHRVVVSTLTATGRERAENLFGEQVQTLFAPIDSYARVRRWLDRLDPAMGLIAETELWPELLIACQQRALPLVLVNARLAPRAMRLYRRFRPLFRRALEGVSRVICQTEADARRFAELGVADDRLRVAGNLKFDMPLPADLGEQVRSLRARWGERPAWVAGSTRSGEDALIIDAHRQVLAARADALLVLAPRHPERSDEITQLLNQAGLDWQTIEQAIAPETRVVVVDRIGALLACYAAASVAFVGGSLVDIGGHNLIEPAACGKPVIAGPFLHQQAEAADALIAADGLMRVENAQQLAAAVIELWRSPEQALHYGGNALEVVEQGRGSLRRTIRQLEDLLSATAD